MKNEKIEEIVVTEETQMSEIMKHKEGLKVLDKYNVPCMSCPMASHEMQFNLRIKDIPVVYGIDKENLIKELNLVMNKEYEKEK
jgi:hypothetical protein